MKIIAIISIAAIMTGCASTHTVPGASNSDTINTVFMSCSSPYKLKQDCSIWSGATRNIVIEGFEVNVSASEDGKTILVMDSNLFSNTFSDILTLNSPTHSKASNNSYYAVRKVLDKASIQVSRVRPLKSFGNVDGYVLELAGDGYTLLKTYR